MTDNYSELESTLAACGMRMFVDSYNRKEREIGIRDYKIKELSEKVERQGKDCARKNESIKQLKAEIESLKAAAKGPAPKVKDAKDAGKQAPQKAMKVTELPEVMRMPETVERDRFGAVRKKMADHKYKVSNEQDNRLIFAKKGCKPIYVYMESFNSIPQYSIENEPYESFEAALDVSRTRRKHPGVVLPSSGR